jgi:hypothetical protein
LSASPRCSPTLIWLRRFPFGCSCRGFWQVLVFRVLASTSKTILPGARFLYSSSTQSISRSTAAWPISFTLFAGTSYLQSSPTESVRYGLPCLRENWRVWWISQTLVKMPRTVSWDILSQSCPDFFSTRPGCRSHAKDQSPIKGYCDQSRRACPACPGVPWELVEGDG